MREIPQEPDYDRAYENDSRDFVQILLPLFPRMAALAENAWTAEEKKSWERFAAKMPVQFDRYDLWGIRYSDYFFQTEDIERKR